MQVGTIVNDGSRAGIVVLADADGYGIGWFSEVTRSETDENGSSVIAAGADPVVPAPIPPAPIASGAPGLYTESEVEQRIADAVAAEAAKSADKTPPAGSGA